jgi:hypothetical protein
MFRRLTMALLGALSLVAVAAPASSGATAPTRESGNPINDQGSSYHYRSNVTAVTPSVPGLQLEVLEFADRLVLTNHTGRTITVYGYEGEPYARVLADGTVQVNTRSPAYFLNQNFYGDINVPSSASASAPPRWTVLDRTAQLEWHDHRIHWMSPAVPPQVKDQSRRTKIFDWRVPIRVGAQPGAIDGQLFWVPPSGSKTPLGAIIALAVVLVAAIALVLFVRRRRRRGGAHGGGSDGEGGATDARAGAREAW